MVIVGWDVADYALLLARYSTLLLGKISWGGSQLGFEVSSLSHSCLSRFPAH